MKTLFSILFAVLVSGSAMAGTTCREDTWGNVHCSDTSGNSSTIRTDTWGNKVIRDNRSGKTTTCRTDTWGNIHCN